MSLKFHTVTIAFLLLRSTTASACWYYDNFCYNTSTGTPVGQRQVLGQRMSGGVVENVVLVKCCYGYPSGTTCTSDSSSSGQPYFSTAALQLHCDGHNEPPHVQNSPENQVRMCGSDIGVDMQTLGESLPIVGSEFRLTYSSMRQIGYKADDYIGVQVYNSTGAGSYDTSADVSIAIGNQSGTTSHTAGANVVKTHQWNQLDSAGNVSKFSQPVTVSTAYNMSGPSGPGYFQYPPPGTTLGYIPTGLKPLGHFKAKFVGLGGWQLDANHAYDVNKKTIEYGDGTTEYATSQVVSGNLRVISRDGKFAFIFDSAGTHLETKSALTGATVYTFGYNSSGQLLTATDAFANTTTVTYSSGLPTQITSPYGQVTTLATDSNGYLNSISVPGFGTYLITNYSNGLMNTFTKPSGEVTTLTYDSDGRLTSDSSSAGPSTSLARTATAFDKYNVTATSNLGRQTVVNIQQTPLALGSQYVRTENKPSLAQTQIDESPLSSRSTTDIFGMQTSSSYAIDPRFSTAKYVNLFSEYSIANKYTSVSKTASLNSTNPFDINSLVTTVKRNFAAVGWVTTFSGSTKTATTASPVGRVRTQKLNANEQTIQTKNTSDAVVDYTYDSRGRLWTSLQGTRTTTLSYNANGFLSSIVNPMSQSTSFTYDSAGRVLTTTLPDSRVVTYTYDTSGNLTSISPPSSSTHYFTSNLMNLMTAYQAPSLGSGTLDTTYVYSNDRELKQITRPSGAVITLTYDTSKGTLSSVASGANSFSFVYGFHSTRPVTSSSPDGVNASYSYARDKLTALNYGTGNGSVSFGYNSILKPSSFQIGSGSTYTWTYDADELLKTTGSENLNRSSTTGRISDTALSNALEYYTYDATYGDLASYQAKYTTSTNLFLEQYVRDSLGRITTRTVTIGSSPSDAYVYTYDVAGRLTDVTKNSILIGHYVYDSNSNRVSSANSAGTLSATYDAQDRLLTYGTKTFSYNLNGERTSQADSALTPGTTSYTWDAFGNLKQVTLPSTTQINYRYDAHNRRVTRLTASTINQKYVYLDQTRLLGVLDAAGATQMTFFYGERNTPEYMIKSGTMYKLFVDHVGSVRQVVNSSTGAVAQELTYDEFGRILSDSSPGFQPFAFAGGLYDADTKLTQFGARWYDAEVGRFISKDPILFGGGDTNLYGYVMNDPINGIDPTGLKIRDPQGLIPSWIKRTEMYKRLDAMKDVYVDVKAGELSGAYGQTFSMPGGHHQSITIDQCKHTFGSRSPSNKSLTNYEDTVLHELFHAEKNLSRFIGGEEDHASDQIPAFINSIDRSNYGN